MICSRCASNLADEIEVPTSSISRVGSQQEIPSDNILRKARGRLSELEQASLLVDGRIAEFTKHVIEVLGGLGAKKTMIEADMALEKSILSPWRRIPDELISKIFLHLCQPYDYPPGDMDNNHFKTSSQTVISQVCSRWRTVATSTLSLWTSIPIVLYPPPFVLDSDHNAPTSEEIELWEQAENNHLNHHLIALWLARSGSRPLHISLEVRNPSLDLESHRPQSLALSCILRSLDRWSSLLLANSNSLSVLVQSHLRNPLLLPHLSRLEIRCNGTWWPVPISIFELAPNLLHLSLDHNTIFPSKIQLLWNQLVSVTSITGRIHQCLDVIRMSSNLQKYELRSSPLIASHRLNLNIVPLQAQVTLHTLILRLVKRPTRESSRTSSMRYLFDNITIPALQHLEIDLILPKNSPESEISSVWAQTSLSSFLQRSRCSLTRLAVMGNFAGPTDDQLIQCLRLCPDVRQFTIQNSWTVTTKLLDHLANSTDVAPLLEDIKLSLTADCLPAMTKMVESRWRPGSTGTIDIGAGRVISRLKAIAMEIHDDKHDNWRLPWESLHKPGLLCVDRLMNLRDEGLDISLLRGKDKTRKL